MKNLILGLNAKGIKAIPLSKREKEIIGHIADGDSIDDIADQLYLSKHTVRTHRDNARKKLGTKSIAHAIAKAIRKGYIR